MQIPLLDKLNKKIGIDLGTARTRITVAGSGIVADEATCIAFDRKTKNVLAVGEAAVEMDGRVGDHIEVSYPVVNGRIHDMVAVTTFLKIILNRAIGSIALYNPIMMISVPVGATQADREIATQVLYALGAGETYTIAQPLAAGIGAGVPIADASGSFLLHMGAGVIEGVVISLGSVIVSESRDYGGDYFSNAMRIFVQKNLDLKISKSTANALKQDVVTLQINSDREKLVAGQDLVDENPKEVMIKSKDLLDHTLQYLQKIEDLVVELLSKMPSELAVDVIDKGLLLTGGTAQLHGIEVFFVEKLGIPVSVVDNAEDTTAQGITQALEALDLFKKSLGYQE